MYVCVHTHTHINAYIIYTCIHTHMLLALPGFFFLFFKYFMSYSFFLSHLKIWISLTSHSMPLLDSEKSKDELEIQITFSINLFILKYSK